MSMNFLWLFHNSLAFESFILRLASNSWNTAVSMGVKSGRIRFFACGALGSVTEG